MGAELVGSPHRREAHSGLKGLFAGKLRSHNKELRCDTGPAFRVPILIFVITLCISPHSGGQILQPFTCEVHHGQSKSEEKIRRSANRPG